jgi:hypothetical protein
MNGTKDDKPMTVPEFAALCLEKCGRPAQAFEDGRLCGSTSETEEDGTVFHFCGRHWGIALGPG